MEKRESRRGLSTKPCGTSVFRVILEEERSEWRAIGGGRQTGVGPV